MARTLGATLAFGGVIAAIAVLYGTNDLESYDHAFFSLDRGTAADAVSVLGHPVYTLAVGFGARLPLHGSLGASPASVLAPVLPAPVTYWLILTLAIAAAAIVVRQALEPLGGRLIAWLALVLLFCSVPMVNYTVFDDWPETAVTYAAAVASVFAPHALLSSFDGHRDRRRRRLAALSLAAVLWGLIGLAHPGYWPLIAGTLMLSSILALCRFEYPLRTRLAAIAMLGAVSLLAVVPQVPDVIRELTAAGAVDSGSMKRLVEGPTGRLLTANAFPVVEQLDARLPFTCLFLALVSLVVGITADDPRLRRLVTGSALISVVLAAGAATFPPPPWLYAPSAIWALRDPAIAFAVLGGAGAAALLRRAPLVGWTAVATSAVLTLAAAQGPMYAANLLSLGTAPAETRWRWTQDLTAPAERVAKRGFTSGRLAAGGRLAFWPDVRDEMRRRQDATTDFADAGYPLVTAWTKQRTMRGLVEPNDVLFNQAIELSPQVLCDAVAVHFLQLRYLLRPAGVPACAPWTRIPDLLVDGWLEVDVVRNADDRVRALPVGDLTETRRRAPALSAGSPLLPALLPLAGTSLTIASTSVAIRLDDPSAADGQAMVLPIAYDPAWRAPSGQTHNVGGLLAVTGINERQVKLDYAPDLVAVVRALAMTLSQVLAVAGLMASAYIAKSR